MAVDGACCMVAAAAAAGVWYGTRTLHDDVDVRS